jgi:hypothetical protein
VHDAANDTQGVVPNVIIHLLNDLPILADVDALPSGGDRSLRCTNIRTVDGKKPSFVHDQAGTFILPLSTIRLIEAPSDGLAGFEMSDETLRDIPDAPPPAPAEEPNEDLLARIRLL